MEANRKRGRPKGAKDKVKRRSKLFPGLEPIEPAKRGRKLHSTNKLRAPIIEKIVFNLEHMGCSLELAAAGSGVAPSHARRLFNLGRDEFNRRQNGEVEDITLDYHVKFYEVCRLAEEKGIFGLYSELLDTIRGIGNPDAKWQGFAWALERLRPPTFGKRMDINQNLESQVTVRATVAEIVAKAYGYNPPDSKGNFIRGIRRATVPDEIPQ